MHERGVRWSQRQPTAITLEDHCEFHTHRINVLPPLRGLGNVWTRHRIHRGGHLGHIVLG